MYSEEPYKGLSQSEIKEFVESEQILEKPLEASELMYHLMKQCWKFHPKDRIEADQIYENLLNIQVFPIILYRFSILEQGMRTNSKEESE